MLPPALFNAYANQRASWAFRPYASRLRSNERLAGSERGRCFIIGSGPSLKTIDLARLEGENVIALNNFYVHPEFDRLKPRHYVIAPLHRPQSDAEWATWLAAISARVPAGTHFYAGLNGASPAADRLIEAGGLFEQAEVHHYFTSPWLGHPVARHLDLTRPVPAAGACSVYALYIALYLGFQEIYLLGMDHNYFMFADVQQMRFYPSAIHQQTKSETEFDDAFYVNEFLKQHEIFKRYLALKQYAMTRGVRIFNATDTSVLKLFPAAPFASLFEHVPGEAP